MNTIKITFISNGMKVENNCTEYEKIQAMLELMSQINISMLQNILYKAYKEHKKGQTND